MEYEKHPEINEGWIEYCNRFRDYQGQSWDAQRSKPWVKNSIHMENGGGNFLTKKEVKGLIKHCNDNGIKVWSIGSPIGKININEDFEAELEKGKAEIEISFKLKSNKTKKILAKARKEKLPIVDDHGNLKGLITIKDTEKQILIMK